MWKIINLKTNKYYISAGNYGDLNEATSFTWDQIIEIMETLDNNHVVDVNNSK